MRMHMGMHMRDLELEAPRPARAAAGMRNCVLLTGFYLLEELLAAPPALSGPSRPRCILTRVDVQILKHHPRGRPTGLQHMHAHAQQAAPPAVWMGAPPANPPLFIRT